MTPTAPKRIGVLTSGGDAQGMNAAVRAVVRTGLLFGAEVYTIAEGYQGLVNGGDSISRTGWDDMGSILQRGGTVIGTARCPAFLEREGRKAAAHNLVSNGIDRLVVIGGDGSLTGADLFHREWQDLIAELEEEGAISRELAQHHPALMVAGLVGSIDNDMVGTDMTIGADSALHRIVEAIDAISSTAASHQRSFVVEVMGRRCGYLALTSAIAGGCDYVLIPENPPPPGWERHMCNALRAGRHAGRRDSIVVVAEGARDRGGQPISSAYVRDVLEQQLGEDARVTILGHVQRGGSPSAFDRSMPTMMGYAAVEEVLSATAETEPSIIGIRRNRVWRGPLMLAVEKNKAIASTVDRKQYERAMAGRGTSFGELFNIFTKMSEPIPSMNAVDPKRIGILHAGALAPGMNTVARAAVRLGLDRGHTMVGIEIGFEGLIDGRVREPIWGDVEGWNGLGGAELGSRRGVLKPEQYYSVGRALEHHRLDALLVVGGWDAYESVHRLYKERDRYPALGLPILCLPASIDNNLPGSELAVGCDTALNVIVEAIDRVKQSASAARRCFVVEVMGRYCGYLALLSSMCVGAERVYLHEEGVTLADLQADVERMNNAFEQGRRLFLTVRNEAANDLYDTDFLVRLFEEEGHDRFDVRQTVIGHTQQGGNPSPFDRIMATRLTARGIDWLTEEMGKGRRDMAFIGLWEGAISVTNMSQMDALVDWKYHRPKDQWWLKLHRIVRELSEDPAIYQPAGAVLPSKK